MHRGRFVENICCVRWFAIFIQAGSLLLNQLASSNVQIKSLSIVHRLEFVDSVQESSGGELSVPLC